MVNSEEGGELLRRHLDLETQEGDGQQGDFLSGWQCVNPWAGSLAGPDRCPHGNPISWQVLIPRTGR